MFQYDEVRLARWMERKIEAAGVHTLLGAVLTDVAFDDRRVRHLELATRFGAIRVAANGYVDSSGDATITYGAGLAVREPEAPVYGSLNFLIEGYDPAAVKELVIEDVRARLKERGAELRAREARRLADSVPGQGLHAREHHPHADAARAAREREHGVRRAAASGRHRRVPASRVSANLRCRARSVRTAIRAFARHAGS